MNPTISPPSDNLYKFLAVAGLMLLAASFVYPVWQRKEFDQLSTRFDGDWAKLQAEREIADEAESDAIKQGHIHGKELLQLMEAAKKEGRKEVAIPQHLQDEIQKLDVVLAERRKVKAGFILRQKESDTRRDELLLTRRFLNDLDLWAAFSASLGFVVSLIGFSKWFGSQRIQDQVQLRELAADDEDTNTTAELVVPSSEQVRQAKPSYPRLRKTGIWLVGAGACILCLTYIINVKAHCDVETSILDRDAARQRASDLVEKLMRKSMDSTSMDDVHIRRKGADADKMTPKELLEAVEKWGQADPDAKPLEGLFVEYYRAQIKESNLTDRLRLIRSYRSYAFGVGGVLFVAGIGCLLTRTRLVNQDQSGR